MIFYFIVIVSLFAVLLITLIWKESVDKELLERKIDRYILNNRLDMQDLEDIADSINSSVSAFRGHFNQQLDDLDNRVIMLETKRVVKKAKS